jgi:hypothetical protein
LLKQSEPRSELIAFYTKELTALSNGKEQPSATEVQLIFYFTHHLEYYG